MVSRLASLVPLMVLGTAAACAQTRETPLTEEAKPRVPVREHSSVGGVAPAPPAKPPAGAKATDLLSAMSGDLAQRLGVKPSQLEVLAVERVIWDDGSLGCPQPGQSYLMAQMPGVRVLFRNGGQTYQYHAADSGHFVYCANPAQPAGAPDRQ